MAYYPSQVQHPLESFAQPFVQGLERLQQKRMMEKQAEAQFAQNLAQMVMGNPSAFEPQVASSIMGNAGIPIEESYFQAVQAAQKEQERYDKWMKGFDVVKKNLGVLQSSRDYHESLKEDPMDVLEQEYIKARTAATRALEAQRSSVETQRSSGKTESRVKTKSELLEQAKKNVDNSGLFKGVESLDPDYSKTIGEEYNKLLRYYRNKGYRVEELHGPTIDWADVFGVGQTRLGPTKAEQPAKKKDINARVRELFEQY